MFFIRGADRATAFHHEMGNFIDLVFGAADNLWKSYQQKLVKFITDHGGSASIQTPTWERFPWGGVKLVVFNPTVPRVR